MMAESSAGMTSNPPEIKDQKRSLFGRMEERCGSYEPSTQQPLPVSSPRVGMHTVQPAAFKFILRFFTIRYSRTSVLVSIGLKPASSRWAVCFTQGLHFMSLNLRAQLDLYAVL